MLVLPYLIYIAVFGGIFLLLYLFYKKTQNKIVFWFVKFTFVLTFYLIVSFIYLLSFNYFSIDSSKYIVLKGEKDFLLGTDAIVLYTDKSATFFYADHLYNGHYEIKNDTIIIDYNINLLMPFRSSFPEKLIIKDNQLYDSEEDSNIFQIYDLNLDNIPDNE